MKFGMENFKDVIFVNNSLGSIILHPTELQINYSNVGFPTMTLTGHLGEEMLAPKNKQDALKEFTIIELMDEVGRRIKTGDNKKEGKRT